MSFGRTCSSSSARVIVRSPTVATLAPSDLSAPSTADRPPRTNETAQAISKDTAGLMMGRGYEPIPAPSSGAHVAALCFSGNRVLPARSRMRLAPRLLALALAAALGACGATISGINSRPDKYYEHKVTFTGSVQRMQFLAHETMVEVVVVYDVVTAEKIRRTRAPRFRNLM